MMYKALVLAVVILFILFYGYKRYEFKRSSVNMVTVLNNNLELGAYEKSAPKHALFEIVNNNDFNLEIERIIPDCDCYSVKTNKMVIAPHDTLKVDAVFNAYGGAFLKKVNIYYKNFNASSVLFFKGKILIKN